MLILCFFALAIIENIVNTEKWNIFRSYLRINVAFHTFTEQFQRIKINAMIPEWK